MLKNDVLRRVRFILDFNDDKMVKVFGLAELEVTREQVKNWLRKDEDPKIQKCRDVELAVFLNGLIVLKRGKKEGAAPEPEKVLTNNLIFRKLMIAFNLKSEDVIEILNLSEFRAGKHELSAFFRKPTHKNYRECKAQILRNFLNGLQIKFRGEMPAKPTP